MTNISEMNDLISSLALLQSTSRTNPSDVLMRAKKQAICIMATPESEWVEITNSTIPSHRNLIVIKTTTGRIRPVYADTLRQHHMGETRIATAWLPIPDVT